VSREVNAMENTIRRVLVTLDGSPLARQAVPFAAYVARKADAPLHLLRVQLGWNTLSFGSASALRIAEERRKVEYTQAQQELVEISDELEAQGIRAERHLRVGDPGAEIVEALQEQQIELLVMSTHGRAGVERALFGSVAEHVIHAARIPILLIPPACAVEWSHQERLRLLVTLDGSPLAEDVLPAVGKVANLLQAELELIRVVEQREWPAERMEAEQYLQRMTLPLRADGTVQARVMEGAPATAIAAYARESGADVIAMATHGHRGLARLVMGSVTASTLLQAHLPILVVRPTRLAPSEEDPVPDASPQQVDLARTVDA
jgi:nucleotide-binding universal stress UspA family protein